MSAARERAERRRELAQRMAAQAYRGAREAFELATTTDNEVERALQLRVAARRQIDAAQQWSAAAAGL